jgi:hypothetical protein
VNVTSDDVLAEPDGLKEVAVPNPVLVRGALAAGKGLMVLLECILDEFDDTGSPLPGRRSWRPCSTRLRK